MQVQSRIEEKLSDEIKLQHLEVVNESGNHNVPPGSESHFKVVLVSPDFADLKLIARHRLVNTVLKDELAGQVHALAMSPPCLGGSKSD